jgi:hypothetical protein
MVTNEALEKVFLIDNSTLAEKLDVKYFTVATWKHQFNSGKLSEEKKAEILEKFGYQLKSERKWLKPRKR